MTEHECAGLVLLDIGLRRGSSQHHHQGCQAGGPRGKNPLNFIEDYLRGRTLMVRVGDVLSSPRPVTKGLPQGGLISPLLFNLAMVAVVAAIDHDQPSHLSRCLCWRRRPVGFEPQGKTPHTGEGAPEGH